MRTVGDVSELAGVSVRTLHHYDEIGLLSPSTRSEAGYRLYSYEDLARLQEILGWRQLGFSLAEIEAILGDQSYDRAGALRRQGELVQREVERLNALRGAIEIAITAAEDGSRQEEKSMFEGFDHGKYEHEARERWGHTDAYRESMRRTAHYGDDEWRAIRAEAAQITRDFADLLRAGEPASGEQARAVAERHRQHISHWFYSCSHEMHRGLGELYVADERFARNYDQLADGLAIYVRDAIAASAEGRSAVR